MRLLITGAAGMLAMDLLAAAQEAGHEVVGVGHSELDICEMAQVRRSVALARPDVVINCAAYTDVDGAERDPAIAQAVNGAGAGNVAAAAAEQGAWIIHISSDYVFDGSKRAPYLESDAVAPLSRYGASKLAGEQEVARAAADSHTVVRSAWLFGIGGTCFPATILRLAAERDELAVVDDQVGCPTFTRHLAAALVQLAEAPQPPLGVVHCAAAGEVSWYGLAVELLEQAGIGTPIQPIASDDTTRPARRPAYSALGTERGDATPVLPHWRAGLAEYLSVRLAIR